MVEKIFVHMKRIKNILINVKLFLKGSLQDQLYKHFKKEIQKKEDIFLLLCFGDLLGLPVPTYITLKLLPHLIGEISLWRTRRSRPNNPFWEACEQFGREF